jgi:hypothetical protein
VEEDWGGRGDEEVWLSSVLEVSKLEEKGEEVEVEAASCCSANLGNGHQGLSQ